MNNFDINQHKNWISSNLTIENIIKQFEKLFNQTKYLSIQRYKCSYELFTTREINGVIVVGNSTYLESDEVKTDHSYVIDTDTNIASFDRLWVFKDFEKLRNYLRILLSSWMNEDISTGNVESEEDFCKELIFWDDSNFDRIGYKIGYSWNDTLLDYAFGYRKPKELMEN